MKTRTETSILTILTFIVAGLLILFANVAPVQAVSVTVIWRLSPNVVSDATGIILTIDGTSYTQSQFSDGLTLTAAAGSLDHRVVAATKVAAGSVKRYAFLAWTNAPPGLSASNPNGTFTWPRDSSTVTANYTTQYVQTLYYTLGGGGTPVAPSFTANQSGSRFSQNLTTSATSYYFDLGSTWTVTNPLAGSGNSERWQSNQTLNGTISGAVTLNITYYHQFLVNFTYTVIGGGSPTAPITNFTQFGSSISVSASATRATQRWVDSGSTYSYSNLLGGSNSTERWSTNSAIGNISASISVNPSFYHQFRQTLSYSVVGGGSPTAPTFTANEFGSSTSAILALKASDTWFDANASWAISPNPLTGSTPTER